VNISNCWVYVIPKNDSFQLQPISNGVLLLYAFPNLFQIHVKISLPVGQNLQDHISSLVGPFLIDAPLSIIPERDINSDSIADFDTNGKGPLAFLPVPTAGFMISATAKNSGENKWPDTQIFPLAYGVQETVVQDNAHAFNIREEVSEEYFKPLIGKDAFQLIVQLSRPRARGSIRLAVADPFVPPLIDPNYLDNDADVRVILDGKRLFYRDKNYLSMSGPIPT